MGEQFAVGAHFINGTLQTSCIRDGQLADVPDIGIAGEKREYQWFRPQPGQLEYFAATDLTGVRLPDLDAEQSIATAVDRAQASIDPLRRAPVQLMLAVPVSLAEFQRRRLVSVLTNPNRTVGLLDLADAALCAIREQAADQSATLAVAVAHDTGFELALASVSEQGYKMIAHEEIDQLSGGALNHFLLGTIMKRLPRSAQLALSSASHVALSGLLIRIEKSRPMLSRVDNFAFPVPETGELDLSVRIGAADIGAFLARLSGRLEDAICRLKRRMGSSGLIERTVLVGNFEEYSDLIAMLDRGLAPVEVADTHVLAHGAALAARTLPAAEIGEMPEQMPIEKFLEARGQPIFIGLPTEPDIEEPAAVAQRFFSGVGRLIAENRISAAHDVLKQVNRRANQVLAAISQDTERQLSEPSPPSKAIPTFSSRAERQGVKSPSAQRALVEAERFLQAGRPIDAVSYAHRAWEAAQQDHDVLMALLDIHRRGAELLAGPQHFEEAVAQLRCGLQHRENDQPTRKALAMRYLEQALFLEKEGHRGEAVVLLENALSYDDDPAIIEHFRRLGGESD